MRMKIGIPDQAKSHGHRVSMLLVDIEFLT